MNRTRLVVLVLAMTLTKGTLHAQTGATNSQGSGRSPYSPRDGRDPSPDESHARMEEQLSKGRNAERQKRLVDDTNKLLTLAAELKSDVDRTDKNTLSVDVIRKAEEIEKLARSVKERMKG